MDDSPLMRMMTQIDDLMSRGDWSSVDAAFRAADLASEDAATIVGRLRFTATPWNRISEWPRMLARVEDELIRRGIDPKRALRGLYDMVPLPGLDDAPYIPFYAFLRRPPSSS